MALVAHQANLVDPATDPPSLLGGECTRCGRRFFPRQVYGCEACGAHGDALRDVTLPAEGVLLGVVTIRHHMGKALDEPFVLARVLLEPGLAVRAVLTAVDHEPPVGTRVVGTLIDEGGGDAELRFRPESS